MSKGLLQIEPTELRFTFELKKQSSCSVQLTNNTYHYVAFKVKTTAPKTYSVRPHVGVLTPQSTCSFVVTMQPQRAALVDMVCKDKFLIQSTIVPVGTTNDDITSSLFVKDASRYVEENKLKVALINSLHSSEVSPINGDCKKGLSHEKDKIYCRDEILSSEPMVAKNAENKVNNEELKNKKDTKLKPEKEAELDVSKDVELNTAKDVEEMKSDNEAESKVSKSVEELKLMELIEVMKLKLDEIESKLNEAGVTITKLTEERMASNLETEILQEKLVDLSKRGVRKVQVGFPLLYVCMVALICLFLGYRLPS